MWLHFAYRFALWLLPLVVHRGDLDDQIELLALRFLIRDSDTKFAAAFDAVFCAIGARIIKTPVRSPKAKAIVGRFVGTARRECLTTC